MPTYSIQGPDGKTYSIDGPAGATREQVIAKIQERSKAQAAPQENPHQYDLQPEQNTFMGGLKRGYKEGGLGVLGLAAKLGVGSPEWKEAVGREEDRSRTQSAQEGGTASLGNLAGDIAGSPLNLLPATAGAKLGAKAGGYLLGKALPTAARTLGASAGAGAVAGGLAGALSPSQQQDEGLWGNATRGVEGAIGGAVGGPVLSGAVMGLSRLSPKVAQLIGKDVVRPEGRDFRLAQETGLANAPKDADEIQRRLLQGTENKQTNIASQVAGSPLSTTDFQKAGVFSSGARRGVEHAANIAGGLYTKAETAGEKIPLDEEGTRGLVDAMNELSSQKIPLGPRMARFKEAADSSIANIERTKAAEQAQSLANTKTAQMDQQRVLDARAKVRDLERQQLGEGEEGASELMIARSHAKDIALAKAKNDLSRAEQALSAKQQRVFAAQQAAAPKRMEKAPLTAKDLISMDKELNGLIGSTSGAEQAQYRALQATLRGELARSGGPDVAKAYQAARTNYRVTREMFDGDAAKSLGLSDNLKKALDASTSDNKDLAKKALNNVTSSLEGIEKKVTNRGQVRFLQDLMKPSDFRKVMGNTIKYNLDAAKKDPVKLQEFRPLFDAIVQDAGVKGQKLGRQYDELMQLANYVKSTGGPTPLNAPEFRNAKGKLSQLADALKSSVSFALHGPTAYAISKAAQAAEGNTSAREYQLMQLRKRMQPTTVYSRSLPGQVAAPIAGYSQYMFNKDDQE